MPIRFDTRFYLALAPPHSPPEADGGEIVDAAWMNPQDALERGAAGEIELVFPTIKHLESLLPYATAEEAIAAARELGRRADHAERRRRTPTRTAGWKMLMPGDDGYVPPELARSGVSAAWKRLEAGVPGAGVIGVDAVLDHLRADPAEQLARRSSAPPRTRRRVSSRRRQLK